MEQSKCKRNTFLICLGLVVLTLVAYEPLRHNEFIHYDDLRYITENPQIKVGITWQSIGWAFSTSYAGNWHPLTWLSHMVDYQLFGLNPLGHHLVNLLFHLVNTLLLFWVLKSVTRANWSSAFVAAAFALHPLHVESVAWAAERKDVLSTFFWMLTMIVYVRYARDRSIGKYVMVVLIYAIGLTAKPMLVTLPFVLLLLDWWPLGRFQGFGRREKDLPVSRSCVDGFAETSVWRLIMEKIPLFALVIASCIVTYLAQQSGGAVVSVEIISVKCRMANALVSYVGYMNKMVYPGGLAIIYPLLFKLAPTQQLIFCFFELAAVSVVVVYFSRRFSYLAVGWLWYLGTLVPVIGLLHVGSAAMADRYTYVPSIGIFIMVAWGGAEILAKLQFRRIGVRIIVSIILLALVTGTRKQIGYWQNSLTLFKHAVDVIENNYVAHYNMGIASANLDRYHKAIEFFKMSVSIKPDYAKAYHMLGFANSKLNRHQESIGFYEQAIRNIPDYSKVHYFPKAYYNLGVSNGKLGHYQKAIYAFKQAISIKPDFADAHYNLGAAYFLIGNKGSALDEYKILKGIDMKLAKELSDLIDSN